MNTIFEIRKIRKSYEMIIYNYIVFFILSSFLVSCEAARQIYTNSVSDFTYFLTGICPDKKSSILFSNRDCFIKLFFVAK